MRGFSDSGKPAGIENYFILNVVEDIKELVTGLGKQKFNLVAHDYGGFISWTFASKVKIFLICHELTKN